MADEQLEKVGATQRERAASADPLADLDAASGQSSVDEQMAALERELLQENRSVVPARAAPPADTQPERPRRKARREESEESEGSFSPMSLVFGLVLAVAGIYLILQRVTVFSGAYYWNRWGGGQEVFGLTLIPLLIGIGLLIYGKRLLGWAVTGAGALIILLGILGNLRMAFIPSSLFEVILMFGMVAAGLALAARSVKPSSR